MRIKKISIVIIFILCFISTGMFFIQSQHSFSHFVAQKKKFVFQSDKRAVVRDIDNDGKKEQFVLQDGKVTIMKENKIIWQSPPEWWVDEFALADVNNDQVIDINLSVWKSGSFGSSKPFWIQKNDTEIKNHFFIFDLVHGNMHPVWQSSNLDAPTCSFIIADSDHDGKNDLLVTEGEYAQKPACTGKFIALWRWNGWGFSNEWRLPLP